MEGETEASIATQLKLFHDRVLPTLDNNIKSGNSLIGIDFYNNEIDFGEERKIKPFSWQKNFPEVFKQGGFDCVIGNPPYVQLKTLDKSSQTYLLNNFKATSDLYSIFIEQSFKLVKQKCNIGFIVPSLFLKGVRYQNLRTLINSLSESVLLNEQGDGVFGKVQMPTCIVLFTKGKNKANKDFFINNNQEIFKKVQTIKLEDISIIKRGLEIGKDKLLNQGNIKCLSGSNIDSFLIKEGKFISKAILTEFSKDAEIFIAPKILVRETGNRFFATLDYSNSITTRSIYNTRILSESHSSEFILGIINSSLFKFYFKQFISPETNIFPKIRIAQLKELPIPLSFNKTQLHNIEKNVIQLLQLNQEKQEQTLQSKIEQIQSRIDFCEQRINEIVYQLYGLTEEEIKVVENN